jgi:hypothetical protein
MNEYKSKQQEQGAKESSAKPQEHRRKQQQNSRKMSFRERWRKTAIAHQVEILIAAFGLVALSIYTCYQVKSYYRGESHYREEHRPVVILNIPIQLLDPAIYSTSIDQFNTGGVRVFYKNISKDAMAKKTFALANFSVVPIGRSVSRFDFKRPEVTDETCKHAFNIPGQAFIDAPPGEQRISEMRQTAAKYFGPEVIKEGETFQVYAVACIHYSEEDGAEHGTCDSFRLAHAKGDIPIDGDESSFSPNVAIMGTFGYDVIGHCAN